MTAAAKLVELSVAQELILVLVSDLFHDIFICDFESVAMCSEGPRAAC